MAETQAQNTSNRFPKAQKLWGETSVDYLFSHGASVMRFPLRAVYLAKSEKRDGEAPLRMMVSVGKKKFKRAVKRNRVKRLVREAWRLAKAPLEQAVAQAPGVATFHVAFIFTGKEMPEMPAIEAAVAKITDKLIASLKPHNETNDNEPCAENK